MPWLIGDRMDLHPIIIIVVLLVGGELGGLVIGSQIGSLLGMFFAAPLTSLARVLIRRYWLRLRAHDAKKTQRGKTFPSTPIHVSDMAD